MVDEETLIREHENLSPARLTEMLALAKAKDVQKDNLEDIIVGADTLVMVDREILGKPKDKKDAIKMLRKLSGTTHHVITGICILFRKIQELDHEVTAVTFKKLSDSEIFAYVETGESVDAAGAYKIQEHADKFVASIQGDYENIVGFPLSLFRRMFEPFKDHLMD